MVGVGGLEPPASWSRTKRATNCATPRKLSYYREFLLFCQEKNPRMTHMVAGDVPISY